MTKKTNLKSAKPKTTAKQTKDIAKKNIKEKPSLHSGGHIKLRQTKSKDAKWYVIHAYSGHEVKVVGQLLQRIETMSLKDKFFEILIPTQDKIQIKGGKKQEIKEKIFPGYILIKMIINDQTWLTVRTTQGITGFVGVGSQPTSLPQHEVDNILKFTQIKLPKYQATFSVGEAVKITDGPFSEFLGSVESVDDDKGKIKVLVSIFGRETPVELDFLQVTKI